MSDDEIERRLAEFKQRTDFVAARAGFSRAVMQRLAERPALAFEQLVARDARRVVIAAALLALIAVVASLTCQRALDASLATDIEALGGEW